MMMMRILWSHFTITSLHLIQMQTAGATYTDNEWPRCLLRHNFHTSNISQIYLAIVYSSLCDNWEWPPVDAQESCNSNPDLAAACVYVCIVPCCSRGLYWQSYLNVIPVFTPPSLAGCRHLSATWPHTDTNCFLHRVKSRNPTRSLVTSPAAPRPNAKY